MVRHKKNISASGCLSITLFFFFITGGIAAASSDTLELSVTERAGIDRSTELINGGIPLPRSWHVTDVNRLRLTNASGSPIPAQFHALARWGAPPTTTSAPIKWVLVGFLHTIAANSTDTFTLDRHGPGPAPTTPIQTDSSVAGKLSINTGSAIFEINTDDTFNLIHQVTCNGQELLDPLTNTTAIDAALRIVSGATPNDLPRTAAVSVERAGAINTVVKAVGSIPDATGAPLLDYTVRLHFFAGSASVRIDFTVENNHPVVTGSNNQPTNVHNQGAVNSVYVDHLQLAFKLDADGGALRVISESNVDVMSPAAAIRLYQGASGTRHWDAYVGNVGWNPQSAAPRLQSYCTSQGYTIAGSGVLTSGRQALGWMSTARGADSGMTLAVRDFWQNFPKAIQTDAMGILYVDLFPNGSQFNHNLRVGEEKTHSVIVSFDTRNPTASESEALATAFNHPLFAMASAQWCVDSGVIGEVPAADATTWPLYENYVNVAFKPNPDVKEFEDDGYGNLTLVDAIENFNFYGWQDYGDVPLDYEAFGANQAGQMNLKYWYLYGMLVQYLRSGQREWLDLALPAARHLADIDFLHIPDDGIQHWSHGAYFGHSAHDEPGNIDPNRNVNSPSLDLFFGVPDLLLAYYLTGETRFLEVATEGLASMDHLATQFGNFSYPVFYRERAGLIFAYIEGYKQSGDGEMLDNLQTVVGLTADTSNKGWLSDPNTYIPPRGGPEGSGERISGFQLGLVAWSLGRYLDFCNEYGITDNLGVAPALAAYGDFIIDHMLFDIPDWFRANSPGELSTSVLTQYTGHVATIDSLWFIAPYETYLEVNNWALLIADVLAYAYKYNPVDRYLDTAAQLYTTGTLDPVWIDDPAVYIATKDHVNACNWGLVYMNTVAAGEANGDGADTGDDGETDGGHAATSDIWIKAVLQVPSRAVVLKWQAVGTDTTPSGDRVVSGYFYAHPDDFDYGSVYNPEVFVKIYIATSGWCNIAFNHVTVDDVTVSSANNYRGSPDQSGLISLTSRLAEHQYSGIEIE